MALSFLVSEGSPTLFQIHFDVENDYLRLSTFVETARQSEFVIDALNDTFFGGELRYELVVLPPEPGSFLSNLALAVSGGVISVFAFLNTDVGKAYVEGLTGHEPAHWARQVGMESRVLVDNAMEWLERKTKEEEAAADEDCEFGASVVVGMTRGILERDNGELEQLGTALGRLPDAVEARGEFYRSCFLDSNVRGIGFDDRHEFPIPRRAFFGTCNWHCS